MVTPHRKRNFSNLFLKFFSWIGTYNRQEYILYGFLPIVVLLLSLNYAFKEESNFFFFTLFIFPFILILIYMASAIKRWRDIGVDLVSSVLFPLIPMISVLFVLLDEGVGYVTILLLPMNILYLMAFPSNFIDKTYKGLFILLGSFFFSFFTMLFLSDYIG